MKTINFSVDEDVYDPFKKAVEENGMRVAGLFKLFMKSYAGGTLGVSNGEIVSISETGHVPRKPGRPKEEKEPSIIKKEEPKPFKFNPKDPWNSDFSNLKYGDIAPLNWTHPDVDGCTEDLEVGTVAPVTGGVFRDYMQDFYIEERPKYFAREWETKEFSKFLATVAWMFILQNGLKHVRYNEESIWMVALECAQFLDQELEAAGQLKKEEDSNG